MSLNSVNILGNLTRDPELKYTSSGRAVCNMSIANNRVFTANGEKREEVSYFDIEVWGAAAENCSKYLAKGRGIVVDGRLKQDRWEKDGKMQSRVRIVANNVHFLPGRRDNNEGYAPAPAAPAAQAQTPSAAPPAQEIKPEDIAWDE